MKVQYLFFFLALILTSCGYKTIPTSLYESRSIKKELLKGSTLSANGDILKIPATNKMEALNLQFGIHKFEPQFLNEENVYYTKLDTGYGVIKKMRPFLFFPKRWTSKKTSQLPGCGVLKKI